MSKGPEPSGRPVYEVLFTKTARKDYDGVTDSKLRRGVNRIIERLKENPYQFKKLSGPLSHLRTAKTFSFRLLYHIEGEKLIVYVVSIEHRKQAYD